eukprot:CFRG2947T1
MSKTNAGKRPAAGESSNSKTRPNNAAMSRKKRKYATLGMSGNMHTSTLLDTSSGVLVSIDRNTKSKAQREASALLNEALKKIYPDQFDKIEAENTVDSSLKAEEKTYNSIEEELAAEIEVANGDYKKGTIEGVDSLVHDRKVISNEMLFFQLPLSIDPEHFVHTLLSQLSSLNLRTIKYCHRLVPVTKVCRANVDKIREAVEPLIRTHFHSGGEKYKYSVLYKCRYNDGMKDSRSAVIDMVAGLVDGRIGAKGEDGRGYGHTVDLSEPQKSVMVEIMEKWCLLSVVTDYFALRKYNLVELNAALIKDGVKGKKESKDRE